MKSNQLNVFVLVAIVLFMTASVSNFQAKASPTSSYYYNFTVNTEGFTNVEINFSSTDSSGTSWVVVPKFSSWGPPIITAGSITTSQNVSTSDVGLEDLYFYQAFRFSFRATAGSFAMTIRFSFPDGALIIESRGIFFSPQIGYQQSSSALAEVFFDNALTVNSANAIAVGSRTYSLTAIESHHVLLDPLPENLLRLQVEFSASLSTQSTTLTSQNKVFSFSSPNIYVTYASTILNLYERLYNNYTRLFNVTLTPPIGVQFFLPSFQEFLSLGGFTPFTEAGAGKININIFFIRAVNGTIEVIAAHELVHHFLIKAGLSPNDFLWFHEGMAQYVSVTLINRLGYEGARQEGERLNQSASQLIQQLRGENFGFLQNWSPSISPTNAANNYVASYFVTSRLAQDYGGLDYYERFFELIHGVEVYNIDILALYLSRAADASVALTLQSWGFRVIDLYTSPEIRDKIVETQRAIAAVNPVFQPYRALAEFLYRQALFSFQRGDTGGGMSLLQDAIIIANLAPLLTLLTITAVLGIIIYVLHRRSQKAKKRPMVPPPPPEIFSKGAQ